MCGVRTSHYDEIESLSERRESEEIMMAEVCVGNLAEMCIVLSQLLLYRVSYKLTYCS